MSLLSIENLHATFHTGVGSVKAVRGISLHMDNRESIGIVGESGSGKSVSMLAMMGLVAGNCQVTADKIVFDGRDLTHADRKTMRRILGKDIAMVFQDPMTCLNPLYTIGNQLIEPIKLHLKLSPKAARARAVEMLKLVEIPDAEKRMKQYPHEFSGGMRQRAMIAMALSCNPKLLVCDEPTTALDVTIQAQILDLLKSLQEKTGISVIMITHDLGVITNMCARILVMYGGQVVEEGTTREIFYKTGHPYTLGLLRSLPRIDADEHEKLTPIPGTPPDMLRPPAGCPFAARCPYAMQACVEIVPACARLSQTHRSACHLWHPAIPLRLREEVFHA
ncbi:MAG TPA: ABC transporter ATP-binding protein [Clostridia bacterium]|nr:ABC transporter ATP-binding protein [Clostridia bacterium]